MNIQYSSELMKNQQQAIVMPPDQQFQVLQTNEGNSLFFSIGDDGVFYCTREVKAISQGWQRTDLSSALSANYNGAAVTAKSFDVSQNASTGDIDIALVITVGGNDELYVSLGIGNDDDSWQTHPDWSAIPFDDPSKATTGTPIAGIFIAQSPTQEYIMAYVEGLEQGVQCLFRYYVDPSKSLTGVAWNMHDLAINLQSISQNCLGRKAGQEIDGVYTLGTEMGVLELVYTPLINVFKPSVAASPTNLTVPVGATAIAVSYTPSGYTDLFVAAGSSLYFYASTAQANLASGVLVYTHPLLTNLQALYIDNAAGNVIVWGLNQQGDVFYLKVQQGSETDQTAWSCPAPIVTGATALASFANYNAGNSVLFAHVSDNTLIQLTQDPVTTAWVERSIVLPSTDVNDYVETYTYTTHVQFTDDNNMCMPSVPVTLTPICNCSLYINNQYYALQAGNAVSLTSDETGILTIVQETDTIGSASFTLSANDQQQSINPMSVVMGRLQNVTSSSLNVNVTDEYGNSTPLVNPSFNGDLDAVAATITQMAQVSSTMPQDGSVQSNAAASVKALTAASASSFGLSFSGNTVVAYSGGNTANAMEIAAGDIWRWLKTAADDVANFFVQIAGDVTHFFIQLGEDIYHFVMKCMSDVMHGIEFVLSKIGVFLEDLVKWIGFIFSWNDIVVTHKVMKNVLQQFSLKTINGIAELNQTLTNQFANLESEIAQFTGLPSTFTDSYSTLTTANPPVPGTQSPQTHWGAYQVQANGSNSNATYNSSPVTDDMTAILNQLMGLVKTGENDLTNTYQQLKAVCDNLPTQPLTTLFKQILGIIVDSVLEIAQDIVTTTLNLLQLLVEDLLNLLTTPIDIPVLSPLYKKYTGDDLSVLDVACLVCAIPATIIYKLMKNAAPFDANDADTNSLINATSFDAITSIVNGSPSLAIKAAAVNSKSDDTTLFNRLAICGNIFGAMGAFVLARLTPVKIKLNVLPINLVYSAAYVPYVAPDIMASMKQVEEAKWWAIMNEVLCGLGIIKACADTVFTKKAADGGIWVPISPWVDCGLNLVWQAPTSGGLVDPDNQNTVGLLSYLGGTLFDLSGVMSPGIADDDEPISFAAFLLAITVSNMGYGALCFAQAALIDID